MAEACYDSGNLAPVRCNMFLAEFARSREAIAVRQEFARYPQADRVRLRYPRPNSDAERQGDLIVLKHFNELSGERGVLLVTYTEAIRRFAAVFDLSAIASRYSVVLEPSSWGYQDPTFLFYLGADLDVVVQCPWRRDYEFISALRSNLVATRIGAGDWVDPALFRPSPDGVREYDLVLVSSWHPVKRHEELFRTMRALRDQHGRNLRVALVGYPALWSRKHIETLADRHGVRENCDILEGIPSEEVARVVGASRAYALLSKREGANRALYEALFCNTPGLVYRHHKGVNTDHILKETGVLFDDHTLPQAIMELLDEPHRFSPREWALRHTGFSNSTHELNDLLRGLAIERGLPWTTPIVAKKNAPNLRYADVGVYRQFDSEYQRLADCLRSVD
jgi:hypothetical protein